MERLAGDLILKEHKVGEGDISLFGPTDIEGHKGKDNRYYLIGNSFYFNLFNFPIYFL